MARTVGIVFVALFFMLRVTKAARFPDISAFNGWWSKGGSDDDSRGNKDVEVVYLPALIPREAQVAEDSAQNDIPLPYSFEAFGKNFDLQLLPNRRLVSPQFRVWSEDGPEDPLSATDSSCHFLHSGPGAVAAFSACRDHALHGLIMTDNSTYEVRPLKTGEGRSEHGKQHRDRRAHIIRRANPPPMTINDDRPLRHRARRPRLNINKPPPSSYTVEIALFLDEAAYKIFHPHLNYNEADLRDMLLAYINAVQALYHHSSLGTRVQLSLVRLTLLRTQPAGLSLQAERGRLLDSFCAYQRSLNVDDDDDPEHWDMALLLSGLDFYSEEGGRRNGVTMGLAPVGGVCLPAHACVVAEFGASDTLGRPYPSAGFTSVYILAHEIGHNLGMHHDGTGNACSRDGYIMSPSRGTNGEATWSHCSAQVVADLKWATCLFDGDDDTDIPPQLEHERFGDAPGLVWVAKKQCEVLLRDKDATPASPEPGVSVCVQLACRTPHRAGFYYAGPALPGTPCAPGKWCHGGECVAADPTVAALPPVMSDSGSTWSEWSSGSCRSGCTLEGRGAVEKRRTCPQNAICEGPSYDVVLCDDSKVCGKKRRTSASELAGRRCAQYAARIPALDARGGGLQAPHDPTRMWMGCAIFCRRASGGGFYAPRVELNDAGLDPYFPDGTWCHHDGQTHYYCLQHHCLPENFKMSAQYHIWELPSEDVGGSFNARARAAPDDGASAALRAYMTLDDAGAPLFRAAIPPHIPEEPESDWEVIDYVEIPARNNTD
ncbi:unnamed protein product [Danaus chrysippus]|uniref:(African queen) hypothetical protein n=1 Tax=Danaus chrysippus TaxID=151541 RepID=A0A8J2R7Y5_9NEOP|nr:unnamed protein product [Danaus chrysippus]